MKLNKNLLAVLLGTVLLTVIAMILINSLLLKKTEEAKTTLVVLVAEVGIARKAIVTDIDWIFVNKATKEVITKKTDQSDPEVQLSTYESDAKNYWTVSAKSKSYSGVAELKNSDLQSGEFKMLLSEIQSAINVELTVQKSAKATTNIPIKWKVPEGVNAKINIQKEDEEALFYAPPNLFTLNYKDNETMLRMPSEPGKYVIRMYDTRHTKEPLREFGIKVVKAHIEINAPSEAVAGTAINLTWESPDSSHGQINIKEESEKVEYYSQNYIRTRGLKSAKLVLPSKEGKYALRWYDFYSKKLVTERELKITKAEVEILIKSKAKAGESVLVKWRAPMGSVATVYLKSELDDKVQNYFSVGGKIEFKIMMPAELGMYYFTWVGGGDKQEMARHNIEVVANE